MNKLLVIQSSLFAGEGQSTKLAQAYTKRWSERFPDGEVVHRDLASDPIAHLTAETFQGFGLAPEERNATQQKAADLSDALIGELKSADEIVIALPMYNFAAPSTFKAWMDHVARVGITFKYTESGAVGLVEDRPVTVFAARGGIYSGTPNDTQSPLVKTFLGFIGLKSVRFVYAEGLALGPESAEKSLGEAHAQIQALTIGEVA